MSQVFSDYVRSLDASGEPPDAESFEQVWAALGRALRSELRKRGLWSSPPRYLGVYGYNSWQPTTSDGEAAFARSANGSFARSANVASEEGLGQGSQGASPGFPGAALEDLLAGCYSHIFIRRIGGLKAQLKVKPNIEGLVFLSIRNFIHDTQKKHDPFGFRIFDVLRRALRAAQEAGELVLLTGDRKIRNDTVLAFDAGADPSRLDGEGLKAAVERWNDTLLPDLVTAQGKARERVIAVLVSFLLRLPAAGVTVFTFQQLIDPLKNDARNRWRALREAEEGPTAIESDGELIQLVRQIQPDTSVEDRDRFEKLAICLAVSLDRLDGPARTRSYLQKLWGYTRAFALDSADAMPSARKLGRHLGIPRDRLPGLLETLGELVQGCRAAISEKPPVNSFEEGGSPLHNQEVSHSSPFGGTPTPRRAS